MTDFSDRKHYYLQQDYEFVNIKGERSTSGRIKELLENIKVLNEYKNNNETPKFRNLKFVTPLSILPIATFLQEHGLDYEFDGNIDDNAKSYLKTIDFPKGNDYILDSQRYVPIACIGTQDINSIDDNNIEIFNKELEQYKLNLVKQAPEELRKCLENKLFLSIVELAINVNEHADTDKFWVYAQNYPRKKRCKICIVDMGKGFLNSYLESGINLENDEEAIETAISGGKSSTSNPKKGYGLYYLIDMFIKNGKGSIVIISGKSAFYIFKDKNDNVLYNTYSLGEHEWKGSIVWTMFDMDTIK